MVHALGIIATTAFIMLCTLLPFLPGRYDSLAAPLSTLAQVGGVGGVVLLTPVGALWLVADRSRRLAGKRFGFALAALIAGSLVWALVSLGALAQGGFVLGQR